MSLELIVISGPIAAGKSTLADALVRDAVGQGRLAAMLEFDHIVDMVRHSLDTRPMRGYRSARRAAAGLLDGFRGAGVDVAVIEGDFWNPRARSEFEPHLKVSPPPRYLTVTVTYDTALARVSEDPLRRSDSASRDPHFLRRNNDDFHTRLAQQPESDLVLDGELPTTDLIAKSLKRFGADEY